MKTQPKAVDQLATVVKLEPLGNGGAKVMFEYSDWGSRQLTAGELAALRQAAGLPDEASSHLLVGRSVMERREADGRIGFAPLLPTGLHNGPPALSRAA